MDELTVYFITRLDAIKAALVFFGIVITFMILLVNIFISVDEGKTREEIVASKCNILCCIIIMFSIVANIILPSTKDMAIIKIVPKLTRVDNITMAKQVIIEVCDAIHKIK